MTISSSIKAGGKKLFNFSLLILMSVAIFLLSQCSTKDSDTPSKPEDKQINDDYEKIVKGSVEKDPMLFKSLKADDKNKKYFKDNSDELKDDLTKKDKKELTDKVKKEKEKRTENKSKLQGGFTKGNITRFKDASVIGLLPEEVKKNLPADLKLENLEEKFDELDTKTQDKILEVLENDRSKPPNDTQKNEFSNLINEISSNLKTLKGLCGANYNTVCENSEYKDIIDKENAKYKPGIVNNIKLKGLNELLKTYISYKNDLSPEIKQLITDVNTSLGILKDKNITAHENIFTIYKDIIDEQKNKIQETSAALSLQKLKELKVNLDTAQKAGGGTPVNVQQLITDINGKLTKLNSEKKDKYDDLCKDASYSGIISKNTEKVIGTPAESKLNSLASRLDVLLGNSDPANPDQLITDINGKLKKLHDEKEDKYDGLCKETSYSGIISKDEMKVKGTPAESKLNSLASRLDVLLGNSDPANPDQLITDINGKLKKLYDKKEDKYTNLCQNGAFSGIIDQKTAKVKGTPAEGTLNSLNSRLDILLKHGDKAEIMTKINDGLKKLKNLNAVNYNNLCNKYSLVINKKNKALKIKNKLSEEELDNFYSELEIYIKSGRELIPVIRDYIININRGLDELKEKLVGDSHNKFIGNINNLFESIIDTNKNEIDETQTFDEVKLRGLKNQLNASLAAMAAEAAFRKFKSLADFSIARKNLIDKTNLKLIKLQSKKPNKKYSELCENTFFGEYINKYQANVKARLNFFTLANLDCYLDTLLSDGGATGKPLTPESNEKLQTLITQINAKLKTLLKDDLDLLGKKFNYFNLANKTVDEGRIKTALDSVGIAMSIYTAVLNLEKVNKLNKKLNDNLKLHAPEIVANLAVNYPEDIDKQNKKVKSEAFVEGARLELIGAEIRFYELMEELSKFNEKLGPSNSYRGKLSFDNMDLLENKNGRYVIKESQRLKNIEEASDKIIKEVNFYNSNVDFWKKAINDNLEVLRKQDYARYTRFCGSAVGIKNKSDSQSTGYLAQIASLGSTIKDKWRGKKNEFELDSSKNLTTEELQNLSGSITQEIEKKEIEKLKQEVITKFNDLLKFNPVIYNGILDACKPYLNFDPSVRTIDVDSFTKDVTKKILNMIVQQIDIYLDLKEDTEEEKYVKLIQDGIGVLNKYYERNDPDTETLAVFNKIFTVYHVTSKYIIKENTNRLLTRKILFKLSSLVAISPEGVVGNPNENLFAIEMPLDVLRHEKPSFSKFLNLASLAQELDIANMQNMLKFLTEKSKANLSKSFSLFFKPSIKTKTYILDLKKILNQKEEIIDSSILEFKKSLWNYVCFDFQRFITYDQKLIYYIKEIGSRDNYDVLPDSVKANIQAMLHGGNKKFFEPPSNKLFSLQPNFDHKYTPESKKITFDNFTNLIKFLNSLRLAYQTLVEAETKAFITATKDSEYKKYLLRRFSTRPVKTSKTVKPYNLILR